MVGVTSWLTECLSSRQQEVDKGYQTGADMITPSFIPTLHAFSLTLSDGHHFYLRMGLQKGYGETMQFCLQKMVPSQDRGHISGLSIRRHLQYSIHLELDSYFHCLFKNSFLFCRGKLKFILLTGPRNRKCDELLGGHKRCLRVVRGQKVGVQGNKNPFLVT